MVDAVISWTVRWHRVACHWVFWCPMQLAFEFFDVVRSSGLWSWWWAASVSSSWLLSDSILVSRWQSPLLLCCVSSLLVVMPPRSPVPPLITLIGLQWCFHLWCVCIAAAYIGFLYSLLLVGRWWCWHPMPFYLCVGPLSAKKISLSPDYFSCMVIRADVVVVLLS